MSEIDALILPASGGELRIGNDVIARDVKIDFVGVPVYTDDRVNRGTDIAMNRSEIGASITMNIDDADTYRRFTYIQTRYRFDYRQHFSIERRVALPDPSKRRVYSLRGLWRQIRDIVRYEYVKARDGRPPERVTRFDNMLITGVTS